MGCVPAKSQAITQNALSKPDVRSDEDQVEEEKEEEEEGENEEEKGSDFLEMNVDDAKEEIEIDDEPADDKYKAVLPPEPHSGSGDQHSNVKFFDKWKPIPKSTDNLSTARLDLRDIQLSLPNTITLDDIDKRAREAGPDCAKTFQKLNQYLLHGLTEQKDREKLTVRALLVWLSSQNIDGYRDHPCSQDTPEGFLSLIAHKRTMYSTFFTVLCRHAEILCIKVKGVSRCAGYEPGDESSGEDNWTSVYINGKWEIIHPFWVCRSLVGYSAGGWIKLEEMGKFQGHMTKSAAGTLVNAFKEYYFLPNPNEFRYYCHPDDSKWQLTQESLTREEFFKLPYIFPTFFALGLKIVTEKRCLLISKNGEIEIGIQAPMKNANTIEMHYELFLKEQASNDVDQILTDARNMPRLVSMIRCADNWTFKVSFPTEGTYKLSIYGGPYNNPLRRVSDFRIDCKKRRKDCRLLPFDPGRTGFGPGPKSEDRGLFVPSHLSGLVPAFVDKSIDITFQIDTLHVKTMYVKAELQNYHTVSTVQETTVLARQVKCTIENQELCITTELRQEGEYALAIYTGRKIEGVGEDESDDSCVEGLENVCNYILSTKVKHYEKANRKNARQKLKNAVNIRINHGRDLQTLVATIEHSLTACRRQQIPESDPEVMAAEQKLGYLICKRDVRDAILRRNTNVTENTIMRIENSQYSRVFSYELEKLRQLHQLLLALGAFTQDIPTLDRSITELGNTLHARPEVECAVLALMTLLGENVTTVDTWEEMRDGLKLPHIRTKMKSIEKNIIGTDVAKRVKSLLESHSISAVQKSSMAAGEIYKWIMGVVSAVLHEEEN